MSRAFVKEDETGKDDAQVNIPTAPFFATPEGIRRWQAQLRALEASLGPLKGKASPEEALEFNRITREITLLNARLGMAKQASIPPSDQVGFGSHVVLEDDAGETWKFQLVGSEEADPALGAISCYSPLGKSLMGKSPEDTVTWKRQGIDHTVTIISINPTA